MGELTTLPKLPHHDCSQRAPSRLQSRAEPKKNGDQRRPRDLKLQSTSPRCCNPKKIPGDLEKAFKSWTKLKGNFMSFDFLLVPIGCFFCPPQDTSFVWLFLLLARTFRRGVFGWPLGAAQNCHKTVSLKLIAGRHERTQSVHLQASVELESLKNHGSNTPEALKAGTQSHGGLEDDVPS